MFVARDRRDLSMLRFDESMKIYSLSENEIGSFNVAVRSAIHADEMCFHVKAKSFGVLDDVPCGTEINAYVNEKLETLYQECNEFIKLPGYELNRKTVIKLEKELFILSRSEQSGNVSPIRTPFEYEKAQIKFKQKQNAHRT